MKKNIIKISINTTFFTYTLFYFGPDPFVFSKTIVHKINATSYTSIYMHTPFLLGKAQMKYKFLFTPSFFWFYSIIHLSLSS